MAVFRHLCHVGGGNQELISKVEALEQSIQGLRTELAGKLDIGNVTQSTGVTEAGYAADARQLNAHVPGSVMNLICGLRSDIDSQKSSIVYLGHVELSAIDNVSGILFSENAAPWTSAPYTLICDEKGGQRMLVIGIDCNGGSGGAKTALSTQIAISIWTNFLVRKCENGVWTGWKNILTD